MSARDTKFAAQLRRLTVVLTFVGIQAGCNHGNSPGAPPPNDGTRYETNGSVEAVAVAPDGTPTSAASSRTWAR